MAETSWEQLVHEGDALERQADYAGARRAYQAALMEAERLGPSNWRLPLTLHNLGAVSRALGRYPEAENFYRQAIALWEKQEGRVSELTSSIGNLAALNLVEGRLSRAETLYRRGLELRVSIPGLEGLAQTLQDRRRYDEAEMLYSRAAAMVRVGTLEAADLAHNRALLDRDLHRDVDARPLLESAAADYRRIAPNHPKFAIVLRNLAELEAAAGNIGRAGELFTESVRICEAALPPEHPQTGIVLQAYARFLSRTHRGKEARPLAERARGILSKGVYTVDASAFAR